MLARSPIQQTSCFGGLPDVTEHTHSTNNNNNNNHHKNGKRLCKFNKQQLPPLLETLTSNESLPSLEAVAAQQQQTLTTAATSSSGSTSILVTTADAAAAALLTNKPHSFDIFDTKHCFFPSAPVLRANSALTLNNHNGKTSSEAAGLPEALLAYTAKGLSPTGSLKYPYGSGYCSPSALEQQQHSSRLGICGLTTLRLSGKYDMNHSSNNHHGAAGEGELDMKGQLNSSFSRRGSSGKSSGSGKELATPVEHRRWCLFIVTCFIALTVCVVVVSFVLEVVLGDHFVDKSSEDFRLKTIRQLLRETPLIGKSAPLNPNWMRRRKSLFTVSRGF